MKWLLTIVKSPVTLYHWIKLEIRYRKRLKEIRKRDPFIYK
jgi:hypothetical protein